MAMAFFEGSLPTTMGARPVAVARDEGVLVVYLSGLAMHREWRRVVKKLRQLLTIRPLEGRSPKGIKTRTCQRRSLLDILGSRGNR
jgi:hypothetical protein